MLAKDYLENLHGPSDLSKLSCSELEELAAQIRPFLVDRVLQNGGHLASNLGVVELTLALHKVLNLPTDRLIFDVGHQSYVHKLLSGRKDAFATLRTGNGISGFTRRAESEYDAFGCGHSSTSVSAAVGFAQADLVAGRQNTTVAVFGDGAFTGGMIHEALNNCPKNARLILILNENEMSISHNIGRYSRHLAKIHTSRHYYRTKHFTKSVLHHLPLIGKPLYHFFSWCKDVIKRLRFRGNYFENLGLDYIGPVDGHDLPRLLTVLQEAKSRKHTVVLHVKTKKGKGYAPAEQNPNLYHGVLPTGSASPTDTFSQAFGNTLMTMAGNQPNVCAITAAMREGTGLTAFAAAYPKRFYDVGIAEEHALTFAAGLAAGGMHPFVALYSTFLQRGFDNLIHDIALQQLPVTVMIDRAGLNLRDGATHHGIFDNAFVNMIPHFSFYAPLSCEALSHFMQVSVERSAPCAIRYPSGAQDREIVDLFAKDNDLTAPFLADEVAKSQPKTLIVSYGRITAQALKAQQMLQAQAVACGVVALQQLKPIGDYYAELAPCLQNATQILFLEEGIAQGGIGQSFGAVLAQHAHRAHYQILAIEDSFVQQMQADIYASAHIGAQDVVDAIMHAKEQGNE